MLPWVADILAGVAERHGISADVISGRCRYREVVLARREWWECVYASTGCFAQTARLVGANHTSIMHAVRPELRKAKYAEAMRKRRAARLVGGGR